jgi:hypothetical protein
LRQETKNDRRNYGDRKCMIETTLIDKMYKTGGSKEKCTNGWTDNKKRTKM